MNNLILNLAEMVLVLQIVVVWDLNLLILWIYFARIVHKYLEHENATHR